jgi:hypothetical protein
VFEILNSVNDVIVQLQFDKFFHTCQIADLQDVFELQRQVSQIPNRVIVFIKYLIFSVVIDDVFADHGVVDNTWLDSGLLLLHFVLELQDFNDVWMVDGVFSIHVGYKLFKNKYYNLI